MTGFRLLHRGRGPAYEVNREFADGHFIDGDDSTTRYAVDIRKGDIAPFWYEWGEAVSTAVFLWRTTREFGMPFAGGWAEQPVYLLELIVAFDTEYSLMMSEQRERERRLRGN